MRIRIIVTQGGDRGRGQNQIADSLQLQEKNFTGGDGSGGFPAAEATWRSPLLERIIVPCVSRFGMRPAIAFENGPR